MLLSREIGYIYQRDADVPLTLVANSGEIKNDIVVQFRYFNNYIVAIQKRKQHY